MRSTLYYVLVRTLKYSSTLIPSQTISPDSVGHVDVLALLAVDAAHEGEVRLEALLREEPVDEGVEQALVEVVVDPPSVDALGEQGTESAPRDLVGREVGATLGVRKSE